MAKWEYHKEVVTTHDAAEQQAVFNQLGANGWEMVFIVGTDVFFKREQRGPSQMMEQWNAASRLPEGQR